MTEPRLFPFRWHPHEMDRPADGSSEATLVQFLLEPHPEGTFLCIVESGFDAIPAHEREAQFKGNSEGWDQQLGRVSAYVSGTDRIEKQMTINAPMERVWRAISEPAQFAAWFELDAAGARFEPGSPATMKLSRCVLRLPNPARSNFLRSSADYSLQRGNGGTSGGAPVRSGGCAAKSGFCAVEAVRQPRCHEAPVHGPLHRRRDA